MKKFFILGVLLFIAGICYSFLRGSTFTEKAIMSLCVLAETVFLIVLLNSFIFFNELQKMKKVNWIENLIKKEDRPIKLILMTMLVLAVFDIVVILSLKGFVTEDIKINMFSTEFLFSAILLIFINFFKEEIDIWITK
jgi:hypothetical protein